MEKTLIIELTNDKNVVINDVKPEIVRDIREWIDDGERQFYTLVMGQTISVINKDHVVRVILH